MNWFTKSIIINTSIAYKKELCEQDGCCEHCVTDVNLAYAISSEKDSFGTVGSYVTCKECFDKANEEEGEKEVFCHDCHMTVKKKDSIQWRWYDFYAAQGDKPLTICNTCRGKEKHQQRVTKDNEDREAEEDYYSRR